MTPRKEERPVRVRIAPSPTGPITVGTARTALFNWLFARKHGGVFIVRIEDTDKERSKVAFEMDIFEGLRWLGLAWDEGPGTALDAARGAYGPYRQSERTALYRTYIERLLEEKKAYYCYCTKEELEIERQAMLSQGLPARYGGHCRERAAPAGKTPQAIRFKTPEGKVEVKDVIRGKVSFDASLFGDMVIAKSLDEPLYNFAVVVDDALMEISHVIRGEDHLSNTPKQLLLIKTFGFPEPVYAHIPLILAPDRSKLSKRNAEASFLELRERGYLPEALVNFLALLGWHPTDDQEIMSVEELITRFDLPRVQKGGAIFNMEKLSWLNGEHLRRLDPDALVVRLLPYLRRENVDMPHDRLKQIFLAQRTRVTTLVDLVEQSRFFYALPAYDGALLLWKGRTVHDTLRVLQELVVIIKALENSAFQEHTIAQAIAPIVERQGRGEVLWPLRVAVSGQSASPDPVTICMVLGKEESVRRINEAIQKLEALA